MGLILDRCEGCPEGTEPFDHRHQYINFLGVPVTTYTIDGVTYTDVTNAINNCVISYGTERKDAIRFIFSLPLKIM